MKKVKVVWICGFSNSEVRAKLNIKKDRLEPILKRFIHRDHHPDSDVAIWITNGINEIKHREDVELHIISPIRDLANPIQKFEIDGIHYHFVRDENSGIIRKVLRYIFSRNSSDFIKNRHSICGIIEEVKPDLVHVIGAENPNYSMALLDIPKEIPTILQLQALLISVKEKVSGDLAINFAYKGEIEKKLIKRVDYVGTKMPGYIEFIRENIKPDAVIVNTTLAMAQDIDLTENPKEFTFVHYASGLSTIKATDIAVKAFISVHEQYPETTLDLIGNYSQGFKDDLDQMIANSGVEDAITFEGRLATHNDVINQIRKSKYALLPLKTDFVPNTLHEAMANGLPLITTATEGGTTKLNENRESVLISEIGDVEGLANNMKYLLDNPDKAKELRENAAITESELANNHDIMNHWVEVYQAIYKYKHEGTAIPSDYFL